MNKFGRSASVAHIGLTIVELLVVISIVGILFALSLVAVQRARELARNASCTNKLKQIGTGLVLHHDTHRRFPVNSSFGAFLDPVKPSYRVRSWMQALLPNLEEVPVYNRIDSRSALLQNRSVAEIPIELFLCPSDIGLARATNRADAPTDWELAITNYKGSAGSNWKWGRHQFVTTAGRFAGNGDGLSHGNGLLCAGHAGPVTTRLSDITDGTSTSFAVGEVVAQSTRWNWWFHSNSVTATCAIPLNEGLSMPNKDDWENNYGFSSRHASGAFFLFIDGSVRLVAKDVDLATYRACASVQGDEVVPQL